MLQRIQTIYLLCASIASSVLSMYLPYGINEKLKSLFAIDQPYVLGAFLGSALLSLITIFLFKNRKLQFVLGRLNIILNLILLGVFVYWSLTLSGGSSDPMKGIGKFIPIISIVLLVMANKAIKRDEDLVKSVDRLR